MKKVAWAYITDITQPVIDPAAAMILFLMPIWVLVDAILFTLRTLRGVVEVKK